MDQIILSTNEDPIYVDFWRIIARAYTKMFPGVTIHLAFLTERYEDDRLVTEFREFGKVTLFRPVYFVPQFGQAKMIRFLLASQQGDDVCYIDDIDLFPLRKDFITDKTDARPKDHLLCVGGEVYHNAGTYPVSQMTAEGYIWKKFINPDDLNFQQLVELWDREPMYDRREKIGQINDFAKDDYFSDERLMRRLLTEHPVEKFEMARGYDNVLESTLDRMDWKLDLDKLNNHGYSNAHCSRPYSRCVEEMKPLVEYIERNYP